MFLRLQLVGSRIHLGLLSALSRSRERLGAYWGPILMNWGCYLKRGLLGQAAERSHPDTGWILLPSFAFRLPGLVSAFLFLSGLYDGLAVSVGVGVEGNLPLKRLFRRFVERVQSGSRYATCCASVRPVCGPPRPELVSCPACLRWQPASAPTCVSGSRDRSGQEYIAPTVPANCADSCFRSW